MYFIYIYIEKFNIHTYNIRKERGWTGVSCVCDVGFGPWDADTNLRLVGLDRGSFPGAAKIFHFEHGEMISQMAVAIMYNICIYIYIYLICICIYIYYLHIYIYISYVYDTVCVYLKTHVSKIFGAFPTYKKIRRKSTRMAQCRKHRTIPQKRRNGNSARARKAQSRTKTVQSWAKTAHSSTKI